MAEEEAAEHEGNLLTAAELAKMFKISKAVLYLELKEGPSRTKGDGQKVDLRMIPDYRIGGKRFWSREAAEQLLAELE